MRKLSYHKPYRLYATKIDDGKQLDNPDSTHYGRFSTISTKFGIVTVSELNWQHNNGRCFFSVFTTIKDGLVYTAHMEEAGLSDRNLKWMATHFIKNIKYDNPY